MLQTNTCPNTDRRTLGFTSVPARSATPAMLTLFSTDQGTTTIATLTRQ